MAEESKPSRLVAQVDPDKHRRSLALDERPDSRSGFRACRMIGSVNAPFPSNMTRRLPWRSIDDPRRSLTALTRRAAGEGRGGEGGQNQPVGAVTGESASFSQVWDFALQFLGSGRGHKILNLQSGGFTLPPPPPIRPGKQIQSYWVSRVGPVKAWCCHYFIFQSHIAAWIYNAPIKK